MSSDSPTPAAAGPAAPGCGFFLLFLPASFLGGQVAFRAGGEPAVAGACVLLGLAAAGYLGRARAWGRVVVALLIAGAAWRATLLSNDPEYMAAAKARREAHAAKKAAEQQALFREAEDRRYATADFQVTAQALAEEFQADEAAATAKYQGKTVAVTGIASDVTTTGELKRVSVRGVKAGQPTHLGVLFRSPDASPLEGIRDGQQVQALGEVVAYILQTPACVLKEVRERP